MSSAGFSYSDLLSMAAIGVLDPVRDSVTGMVSRADLREVAAREVAALLRSDVDVAAWNAAHPVHPKGADGKWADTPGGVVSGALDKLKLAKRAPAGFTVKASKKLRTDDADVGVAHVDGPDGPHWRVGVFTSESGKWDAGFTGEARKTQLRQEIAEKQARFDSDEELPAEFEDELGELKDELEDLDNERTAVLSPEQMADFRRQLGEGLEVAKANKAEQDTAVKEQNALDEKIGALTARYSDPALDREISRARSKLYNAQFRLRLLRDDPNWAHAIPEAESDVAEAERQLAPLLARRAEMMPPDARAQLEDLERQVRELNEGDITDMLTSAEVTSPNGTRVRAEIWGSDDEDEQWVSTKLFVLAPGEDREDAYQNGSYGYFRGLRGLTKLMAGLDETSGT